MKDLNIHDSWDKHLLPLLSSTVGQELINSLEDTNYHPNKKDIFKAFSIPARFFPPAVAKPGFPPPPP